MSEMQDFLMAHGRGDMALHGLPKGELLALAHASGRLSVLAGGVWLTRANDLDDHFLDAGDSIELGADARVLVESRSDLGATVAWRPSNLGARARRACSECWRLMNPFGRVALGTLASLAALLIAGGLFGPLAEQRSQSLASTLAPVAVAHNPAATGAEGERLAGDIGFARGSGRAAVEARRRAPGAA